MTCSQGRLALLLLVCFFDGRCHGWWMVAVRHRQGSPSIAARVPTGNPPSSRRDRNRGGDGATSTPFISTRTTTRTNWLSMSPRTTDEDGDRDTPDSTQESTFRTPPPPAVSTSLQRHVRAMRDSWPVQDESEGVSCTGEPAVDPTRQILQENVENEEWW
jgi:hypothetical protein